ncbi:MAG: ABC transporter ATP-binding protein/permease [Roseburia sp.]|nr:ABC transporter ATP-binding protein/permease [Roseburia sp.]
MFNQNARIEKSAGKYSVAGNLMYHFRHLLRWEPSIFRTGILLPIPMAVSNMVGNYLPALIVKGLEEGWAFGYYLTGILALLLGMWVCNILFGLGEAYCSEGDIIYRRHYMLPYMEKRMSVDYEKLEEKEFQDNSGIAYNAIFNGRGIRQAIYNLPVCIAQLIPAVIYGVLLARISIWILALMVVSAVIQIKLLAWARRKHSEAQPILSDQAKKLEYITTQTMDPSAGKDIRLYHMADWLIKRYEKTLDDMNRKFDEVHVWYFRRNLGDTLLNLAGNGAVYLYLIWLVTQGALGVSDFVLYFGFCSSFATLSFLGLRELLHIGIISNTFNGIREFLEAPDHRNGDAALPKEQIEAFKKQAATIELRDVSFSYPESEQPIISHMNLTITAGEKLAIIGLNGAGKTTLVKLICGFYTPTEGEILFNGVNVERFARRQYYSLISVLFQDYVILPVTVRENISSLPADRTDEDRMLGAMERADFLARYEQLPNKGDSLLGREINENAVDFSGGEKQKLLLSRALYKEAPLLILDEPTAALDPISENEIYMKYGEATRGRTSIYISHRLLSTRFCDRIILLEDGQIVESGTHDTLMARNGKYANLYELQSQYYKDEEKEKQRRRDMGEEE